RVRPAAGARTRGRSTPRPRRRRARLRASPPATRRVPRAADLRACSCPLCHGRARRRSASPGDTTAVTALDNAAIAEQLERFAALLDLSEASFYSVRAYRRAAELLRSTPAPISELVRGGRVKELRGIGPGIEARLVELVETGRIAELDELEDA